MSHRKLAPTPRRHNNVNIVKVKPAMKSSSDDMNNDSSDSPPSSSLSTKPALVSSHCTSGGVTQSVVPSSPPSDQTDQTTLSDTMKKDENHNQNTSNGNGNDNDNGNGNSNKSTTTLREKEMHFIEAKGVDKVADMLTFGLYGTVTGVRDVAEALLEEKKKCDQQDNEEGGGGGDGGGKHTLTWGHAAYVAANAWTDGGVDIAEEVYEKEAKIWNEKHPYKNDCDQKPSPKEEDEEEKGEEEKVENDGHKDDDVGNEEQ